MHAPRFGRQLSGLGARKAASKENQRLGIYISDWDVWMQGLDIQIHERNPQELKGMCGYHFLELGRSHS